MSYLRNRMKYGFFSSSSGLIDKSECENEANKMNELQNLVIQNIDTYVSKVDPNIGEELQILKEKFDENEYNVYTHDDGKTVRHVINEEKHIEECFGDVCYESVLPIDIEKGEKVYECTISDLKIILYSGGISIIKPLPEKTIYGADDDFDDFDRPNVYQHTTTYTDRVITISDDDDTKVEVKIYDYNSSDIERGNHDYYYPGSLKLLESKTFDRTTDKIKDHLNFEEKGKAK